MIEVKGLTKLYGDIVGIEDIGFKVEKGEILGFLGPNAAGKTTTMRILTGFLSPNRGTARVAGYDVMDEAKEVRKRIGYMPEFPPLYDEMTVDTCLNFVARLKEIPRSERAGKVERVIERVSISGVRDRLIKNLSKGFRQRVGIAQALIHEPEVLILDEPTVGLDPKQIIEIRDLIKGFGGDHTVILSTHILPEATMTCRRVVIINEGRVVAEDTYEGLSARLRKSEKIGIKIENPPSDVIEGLKGVEGVLNVFKGEDEGAYIVESDLKRDIRKELARFVVKVGWGLLEMKPITLSLEDVFLRLTTEEEEVGSEKEEVTKVS